MLYKPITADPTPPRPKDGTGRTRCILQARTLQINFLEQLVPFLKKGQSEVEQKGTELEWGQEQIY